MRPIDADALIKELNNEDNQRILDGLACCNNGDMEAGFMYGLGAMEKLIGNQPTVNDWIPCSERMPEEHDSMFAKLKGTDKWNEHMWEKSSDKVNVTVEFEDGTKKAMTSYTQDGIWRCYKEYRTIKMKVTAWQPLPEPYKEQADGK